MASSRLASRSVPLSNPITGITGCCARAVIGLISYGPDSLDPYRRAAGYVDRGSAVAWRGVEHQRISVAPLSD
jgi:hypothetical protein